MPLEHGKSDKAFSHNVKAEMHAGKPQKQSLAIAYAMKRKAKKAHGGEIHHEGNCAHIAAGGECRHMAEGGEMPPQPPPDRRQRVADSLHKAFGNYAEGGTIGDEDKESARIKALMPHPYSEGGAVEEDDRMLNQHGEYEVGAEGMDEDNEHHAEKMYPHAEENQDDHEDMVGRIIKQRAKHYSHGGQVANDTPIRADFEDNQFDYLVKDDDLEQHYTGANSGDEIGNDQEDEDRRDIVHRIMKSRSKKDRMPRPA